MTDDPFTERRRNGFTTFRPSEPAAGRYDELAQSKSKAELAEEILFRMGDMHSHYDIDARDGGFALVRTFEIDDAMLAEYGLPDEQVFGWSATLDQMHERIIKGASVSDIRAGPATRSTRLPAWRTTPGKASRSDGFLTAAPNAQRLTAGAIAMQTTDTPSELWAAWQTPAFSKSAIEADPSYSRWSGRPLGETAGLAQSDGIGQSH